MLAAMSQDHGSECSAEKKIMILSFLATFWRCFLGCGFGHGLTQDMPKAISFLVLATFATNTAFLQFSTNQ
jgi:hypothetical protein